MALDAWRHGKKLIPAQRELTSYSARPVCSAVPSAKRGDGFGRQLWVMALRGTYTRPSSCAGTFFPVARLVKIIASHSKRTPPLPHLGTRATRAHSLGVLLQSSPGENTWT